MPNYVLQAAAVSTSTIDRSFTAMMNSNKSSWILTLLSLKWKSKFLSWNFGGLFFTLSPGELCLGSGYFNTTEGSGRYFIKRIENVKSFVFTDYWKLLLLMSVDWKRSIMRYLTLGKLLYLMVLFVLFYKIPNTERI